jgi:uncharacterized protein YeaO (DUF488 family)
MIIRTKRIYDDAAPCDGVRILVDRVWPRGVSKARAHLDYWARSCAPSAELRKWYRHDVAKWPAFCERYFQELDGNSSALTELVTFLNANTVTLLYGSKETELNNANALKIYLEALKN